MEYKRKRGKGCDEGNTLSMSPCIAMTFGLFGFSPSGAGGIDLHISHVLGHFPFGSRANKACKNVDPVLGKPVMINNPLFSSSILPCNNSLCSFTYSMICFLYIFQKIIIRILFACFTELIFFYLAVNSLFNDKNCAILPKPVHGKLMLSTTLVNSLIPSL